MVTLEALRAAAQADQPWTRLDELVRAEMATGRRVREVADDFDRLRDEVWNTPGLSEDSSDAFGDTLDALLGNCSQKWAYQDPPTLPTEEEIAKLPRWARVAFAARCARRVSPLFLHNWPNAPSEFSTRLAWAVDLIESVAQYNDMSEAEAGPLTCAAYVVDATINSRRDHKRATKVVEAIGRALSALRDANSPLFIQVFFPIAKNTVVAMTDFMATSSAVYDVSWEAALKIVRNDFDQIVNSAAIQNWSNTAPVSPDVFGPLWPDGPPPGWPSSPYVPARTELLLTVVAGEGLAAGRLADEVCNLFNALNRYHIARTGRRLTLDGDVHTRLAALVPAGAA